MPTVSTVDNTTSARLSGRSDERTVAKSPPYPPAPSRPRFRAAPAGLAHAAGRGRSRLWRTTYPALGELIQPVEHVACRRARLELERRAPLRGVPEEVVERGHRFPPVR